MTDLMHDFAMVSIASCGRSTRARGCFLPELWCAGGKAGRVSRLILEYQKSATSTTGFAAWVGLLELITFQETRP